MSAVGIHYDRVIGCDRDHCDSDRAAPSGCAEGSRIRRAHPGTVHARRSRGWRAEVSPGVWLLSEGSEPAYELRRLQAMPDRGELRLQICLYPRHGDAMDRGGG